MVVVNPHIFRAYDIRGIAISGPRQGGADLTETTVYVIGQGTGTYLQKKYGAKKIIVGRDNRLTSEKLQKAFMEGMQSTGMHVTDVGLSTSPMIYWATCALNFDAGVNITASHNPKEYNGVKICTRGAHSVCGEELQEILKIMNDENFLKGKGSYEKQEIFEDYQKDILSRVQIHPHQGGARLKIVIDSGNGVTGIFASKIFSEAGCDVTALCNELDGNFPNHEANPEKADNVIDLTNMVLAQKADLGIAFDGDGDRVGVVNEKGEFYQADFALIALVRDLLERHPGAKIVFDVKASQVLIDEIQKAGGVPIMAKTGHSFIEQKMKEEQALLGGEVSGHIFSGENYYGFDDAMFAALRMTEVLSRHTGTFSSLFEGIPRMVSTPELRAACPDNRKFDIVKKVADYFVAKFPCSTIDGVRIDFGNASWAAVRCSNTTPNLTLRFEAPTEKAMKEAQKIVAGVLKQYKEVDMAWYL